MNVLFGKLKEVSFSVMPIIIIVIILHLTLIPLDSMIIYRFLIGSVTIILGMSIFLFGVDLAITPLGTLMGRTLTKTNNAWIVGIAGLFLGFFISLAEPALHILAGQVTEITSGHISYWSLIIAVSIGLAIMVAVGLLRSVFNIPLYKVLTLVYAIIFILALFSPKEFLAIAFDSSGATTGAMAVPFMLALSFGVATIMKKGKGNDDSFGLVALASAGAILGVLIMSFFYNVNEFSGELQSDPVYNNTLFGPFLKIVPQLTRDVFLSLSPLLGIFLIFQFISFKLPWISVRKVLKGMIYTLLGLLLFLLGVNAGFMDLGKEFAYHLTILDKDWLIIVIGLVLGLVIILAEPAVYVLIKQIEEVTSGSIGKASIIITLGLSVGIAVTLAVIRVLIPGLHLWHYLLPGYIIGIILMYFTPKLFVGIAFDSGGVASGPMIGTFIFAFIQGITKAKGAHLITDGLGMIALVALSPIISLQILGLIYKFKTKKEVQKNA